MAKGHALFNLPQRKYTVGGVLYAEPEDIEAAKKILAARLSVTVLGFRRMSMIGGGIRSGGCWRRLGMRV